MGGVGSVFGVLGSWTTVFHDAADPVGKPLDIDIKFQRLILS